MPSRHSIPTLGISLQKNVGASPGERERVPGVLSSGLAHPQCWRQETATHQLLHTTETAGIALVLQMLAEKRWKRLDLEIHRRPS